MSARYALLLAGPLGLLAAAPTQAQSFSYSFQPGTSDISVGLDLGFDLTGNLRGAYDAEANPGGTRTLLGIFGDDGGNAEVPVSLGLGVGGTLGGAVEGSFVLDLDAPLSLATVTGLDVTLGAGSMSTAGLDLELMYDTFRTANPTSVFIGGFPLTLPLGSADITDVRLVQSADGIGTAVTGIAAGSLLVTVLVPVDLSFEVALGGLLGGGAGEATPVGPIPLLLPLTGVVDLTSCETTFSGSDMQAFDESLPSPFPLAFDDLPFDLPTLLPPGATANLLLSAGLDGLSVSGSTGAVIDASARDGRVERICAGEPNSTGMGATLEATGGTSVMSADLGFRSTGLPQSSFGFLLMSRESAMVPGFGGSQGTLCLGTPCFRFSESVQESDLLGEMSFGLDFEDLPMGQQFIEAETWFFQYWYRDANPELTSNVTDALRVTFCR